MTMVRGIPFMSPHIMTYIMTPQGSTILHGCTIMKAESVRNEGARQEGLAAPLRTITKNRR